MTVETKLALTEQDIRSFSEGKQEPSWMTELRLKAFGELETLPMPTPDKTKITNWNFTEFPVHTVESSKFTTLAELPEEVKAVVTAEQKNIYIQHNNTPAFLSLSEELKAKGVISLIYTLQFASIQR